MKKIFRIALFALASIGVVSCSDSMVDDNVANNGAEEGNGYAVFKIGTIGSETRAVPENGEFEAGKDNEFAISNTEGANIVLFYAADGTYHSSAYLEEIEESDGSADEEHNNAAEKAYKVNILKDSKNIKYCLLVLNGNPEYLRSLQQKPMAEVKNTIDNQYLGWEDEGQVYFTMTNTVYVKDNAIKTEVQIDPFTQICNTPEEAAKSPIVVHVERVLSKFTLNLGDKEIAEGIYTPENAEKLTFFKERTEEGDFVFESDIDWQVNIKGWGVNATETETYLFKNLGDVASNGWKFGNWNIDYEVSTLGWNDVTRLRSYWAVDPHYQGADTEALYPEQFRAADGVNSGTDGTYTSVKANLPLKYYSYNEFSNIASQRYAVENTFAYEWLTNENVNRAGTHIIVAAELMVGGKAQTVYNYNRAYWYAKQGNGYEDMPDELKIYMMKQVVAAWKIENGAIYNADETELGVADEDADNFDIAPAAVKSGDGRVMLTLKEGTKLYDKDGNEVEVAKFDKYLKDYGTARRFDGGRMYYALPIKHMVQPGTDNYEIGSYGVVRNHWYKATISAINNPGIPVDKPEQPIIPNDDPDEDGYASFEIVIIPWHVVNWDIEL